jgi:hypothetical protein
MMAMTDRNRGNARESVHHKDDDGQKSVKSKKKCPS